MSDKTNISYADHTKSPWRGCEKKSAGCANCYVEAFQRKFGDKLTDRRLVKSFEADAKRWNDREHLIGNHRPRVFVSLCDWLDDKVPVEWLADFLRVVHETPNLDWLVCTKRPENYWDRISAANHLLEKARDSAEVDFRATQTESKTVPIQGFPGYFISNEGKVFSGQGSGVCLWCGISISGYAKRKYCSRKCRNQVAYRGPRYSPTLTEMSPDEGDQGHLRVMLYRDGQPFRELVHRLVLAHFCGPPPSPESESCHQDGNPKNNHICNLRWGTQSDNWIDRKRHGNGRAHSKISAADTQAIRTSIDDSDVLSTRYGISKTEVCAIRSGKVWVHDDFSIPENCWVGVTCEDQAAADERIPLLLQIPAKVRWVSAEPLLEPICFAGSPGTIRDLVQASLNQEACEHFDTAKLRGLDWVVVGGESGPRRRDCGVEAIIDVAKQCAAAGVPCFVKQDFAARPGQKGRIPDAYWSIKQFPRSNGAGLLKPHGD